MAPSFLAISLLLLFAQASFVFVPDPPHVLLPRQTPPSVPTTPLPPSTTPIPPATTTIPPDTTTTTHATTIPSDTNTTTPLITNTTIPTITGTNTTIIGTNTTMPFITNATIVPAAVTATMTSTPLTTQSSAPSTSSNSGFVNTTTSVDDPRINTSGPSWTNSTSSCNPSIPSKKNNVAGQTLTFKFNGSAVFMSTAQSNISGRYSVIVDDMSPTTVDGFTNSPSASCGFSWSATSLPNALHTVIVTTLGQSTTSGSSNQASDFELDGFVTTVAKAASNGARLNSSLFSGFRQFVVLAVTILFAVI